MVKKILTVILVLCLLVSCSPIAPTSMPTSSPIIITPPSVTPIVINPENITGPVTVVDTHYSNTLDNDGDVILTLNVEYPAIIADVEVDSLKKINSSLKTIAQNLIDKYEKESFNYYVIEKSDAESAGLIYTPREISVLFNVEYNQNGIFSVTCAIEEFSGGPHSGIKLESYTYDLNSGDTLTLSHFIEGEDYLQKVSDYIIAEISKNPNDYYADYGSIVPTLITPTSFFISDEGVCIYFQEYDIAAFLIGAPTFILSDIEGLRNVQ